MSVERYDLVVIGAGPAGEKAAARAAYFGKKVALIEKQPVLGGAAANTGTLPSKTLRETSLLLSGFRHRQLMGLSFKLNQDTSVSDFPARERLVKEYERSRIHQNLRRHGIRLYLGTTASFVDSHTVALQPDRCEELQIESDYFLISTGSYPYRPRPFPFHDPRVYDSNTILTLTEMPRSLLVVGGGVIGCEYSCMLAELGVEVTLVEQRPRLLDFLDWEISDQLLARMQSSGIRTFMPDSVDSVDASQADAIAVRLASGEVCRPHAILVCSGRSGATEGLNLEAIGVEVDRRGKILVNENYQTNVPHVYAAGDVIGSPALASTSMEQGRAAVGHAFRLPHEQRLRADQLPYGIYTIPECSSVGMSEQQLQQQKVPYVVGRASYEQNARGIIIGDKHGFLKLLFNEEDMKLVGVHMIGEQATEIIHVGLMALMTGADVELFIRTCFNYPTLTELYKYAAYDALGRLNAKRQAQGGGVPQV